MVRGWCEKTHPRVHHHLDSSQRDVHYTYNFLKLIVIPKHVCLQTCVLTLWAHSCFSVPNGSCLACKSVPLFNKSFCCWQQQQIVIYISPHVDLKSLSRLDFRVSMAFVFAHTHFGQSLASKFIDKSPFCLIAMKKEEETHQNCHYMTGH